MNRTSTCIHDKKINARVEPTTQGTLQITTGLLRFPAIVATFTILLMLQGVTAHAMIRWVDHLAASSPPGTGCGPLAAYSTIGAAVAASSSGDVIEVCAGAYIEDVSISVPNLTLNGAQSGNSVAGRAFGVGESTVFGMITIQAANVTINGFSLSNPGRDTGILVKKTGDRALIIYNIIDTVGGPTFSGNTQGIYLELGPDNVNVASNKISRIEGIASSNGGVFIGDSTSTDPSVNTLIEGNSISDIHSVSRGAYGIHVNNGNGGTLNTGLVIRNNSISNLVGGRWVHAVGLEANTPGVLVLGNSFSTLASPPNTAIAVWFESEEGASFGTGRVNENNFDVTIVDYGIAVDPALSVAYPNLTVDGTCNWWGDPSGPGPVGPGVGARVTPNVDYTPWLTVPAPVGACLGGVPSTAGKVTGGGQIPGDDPLFSPLGDLISIPALIPSLSNPNSKATFGFTVKCCPASGNLEYNDQDAGVRIKAQTVDNLFITSG